MASWKLEPRFHDAWTILRRRKLAVATAVILAMLVAALAIVSVPSQYTATGTLLVKFGREYVYKPEVGVANARLDAPRTNEIINSEIQILTSRDLKERVVDVLGPLTLYPEHIGWLPLALDDLQQQVKAAYLSKFLAWLQAAIAEWQAAISPQPPASSVTMAEEAVLRLERDLRIQGIKDSPVIQLAYTNERPAVARRALEVLVEGFTEKRLRIYSEPQLSFLQQQVEELHSKLVGAEAALERFKGSNDIYNIDEQIRLLLVQESEYEGRVKEERARLGEVQRRVAAVEQQMRETPKSIVLSSEADPQQIRMAEQKLLELGLREQQLLTRYVPTHQVVLDLRQEVDEVRRFIDAQKRNQGGRVTTGRNEAYVKLDLDRLAFFAELQALQTRLPISERQLNDIREQVQKVGFRQRQLRELQREVELHERNYELYRVKAEEERATAALDEERRTNIRIIQSPVTEVLPAGLSKGVKVVLAGIFGLLVGCGVVLFAEAWRDLLYSRHSVETRLGVPVILALPDLRGSSK